MTLSCALVTQPQLQILVIGECKLAANKSFLCFLIVLTHLEGICEFVL